MFLDPKVCKELLGLPASNYYNALVEYKAKSEQASSFMSKVTFFLFDTQGWNLQF